MTETLEAAQPLAEQIRDVAEVVVSGVQQLKESGKIQTNDAAFRTAMDHLSSWFPDVEPARLVPFIEGAYRGVKLGAELLRTKRTTSDAELVNEWLKQQPPSTPGGAR